MAKPRKQRDMFIKIFLPEFSSKQLDLPPAFLKHFNGTFPKDAKLKDHTGKMWPVNLEEREESFTITNGWQSFATEKSLAFGDFLIFKYDNGNCLFDVRIFGRSGCLKEALSSNMTTIDEEICCVPTQTCKRKDSKKSVKRVENLGLGVISCYNLRSNKRTSIGEDKSLKVGTSIGEDKALKAGTSIGEDKALKAGTSIGKDKALKAARYVIPEGPHFVVNIRRWMWYSVYIPKALLNSNGIKIKPEMVLDHNGKKWPVKIHLKTSGGVYFGQGWAAFREEHNLQVGDSCVFELVLGRGKTSQELRVQIIRGQIGKLES